ncbi:MAG: hypothetical protein QOK05_2105 [Chloroflexota bacterium]|jgi:hypothetical protein|nr:hypothetical protein [Chloroflexota bacterium]
MRLRPAVAAFTRTVALIARRRRWAPVLLPVFLALLALTLVKHHEPSVDFHTYVAAARVGLAQGWSDIYDQAQVATAQASLVPNQVVQPFLSPPTVAILAAPLASLPYHWASSLWSAAILLALVLALTWAGTGLRLERWSVAVAAVASTWVVHAIHVGQVVPLVAAGLVVGWRLLREDRDMLAGLAFASILLKPNTAFLLPVALLAAGRLRALAGMAIASVVVLGLAWLAIGAEGVTAYAAQLTGKLPAGADFFTIKGAFGLTGAGATVARVGIVAITVAAAYRLRARPGSVLAAAAIGSLLAAPYLHESDLCLLTVAGWLVWEEHPSVAWRASIAMAWFFSAPFDALVGAWPTYNRWPIFEVVILVALTAWGVRHRPHNGAGEVTIQV